MKFKVGNKIVNKNNKIGKIQELLKNGCFVNYGNYAEFEHYDNLKKLPIKKVPKTVKEFMSLFKDSFINEIDELIVVPTTNLYFEIFDVKTKKDLICKILAWCSRDACKTEPFNTEKLNQEYRKHIRSGLNCFLNVAWDEETWSEMYDKYGNGINEQECRKMIEDNF